MGSESRALAIRVAESNGRTRTAPRSATDPKHLRAHVWIEARHFFSRADAQQFCWLWLLGGDGRVHALRLDAARCGDARLPTSLLAHFAAEPDMPIPSTKRLGPAFPLPNAPVVPLPRWSVSWGHPLQIALRAFAAELDAEVLEMLGWLEAPGPCFGTVENYNRLALLPAAIRAHRLQALREFPPLVAPLLLDTLDRPDMFATDEDEPQRRAHPERAIAAVLEAMDRGRDLVGALATHYGISRALVRAPFCRERWQAGAIPLAALRLLDAVPAHARPRNRASVEDRLPHLRAMPIHNQQADEVARLAQVFKGGWDAAWDALEAAFPHTANALRDTRDFLRSALEQTELPAGLEHLDMHGLAFGWLMRRGPLSLLEASRRWHAQPLVEQPHDDGLPEVVAAILCQEAWRWHEKLKWKGLGCATEITSRAALIHEGERMHHCVGSYWTRCALHNTRILHLEMASGETATAQYDCDDNSDDPQFRLVALRGPGNREPGAVVRKFTPLVTRALNLEELRERRVAASRNAAALRAKTQRTKTPQLLRRLDRRSMDELRQVLDWCAKQANGQMRPQVLLRDTVAGYRYRECKHLLSQFARGDALQLVREPDNPHDPRAVRIDWRGRKLGYVPRAHSAEIAGQLDQGIALVASITAVAGILDAWRPVEFQITLG